MTTNKIASECQNKRVQNHTGERTYCKGCKRVYCDSCYEDQPLHDEETERCGEHEKTDLNTAIFISSVFGTSQPTADRDRLHQKNIPSKWFGIVVDEQAKKSYLNDFGCFGRLLQDPKLLPHEQYPSLVSFVGDTGAGKSTLINGILKLPTRITDSTPDDILAPVMGASNEQHMATSGDVHLFSNPAFISTERPIFYADCEGIDGGEALPAATVSLGKLAKIGDLKELVHKQRVISPMRTRGWAVRDLYPRILFPFSDVVCYVTRDPRRFEHHLETLLSWGHGALDKTTNQPMLPYAFMVINAFTIEEAPGDLFTDWWDTDKVTPHFLAIRQSLVKPNNTTVIGKLISNWLSRGRIINSLEDLIKCYFREFKIICVPELRSSQHSRITAQYRQVQSSIKSASDSSRESRRDMGFLMSAETLERYFEMAFDHFTSTPDIAFNFLSAVLQHSPVTQTLTDHIGRLAIRYMKVYPNKSGEDLFQEIATWVASCIFLNSHRLELPNNDVAELMIQRYSGLCTAAQTEFFDRFWTCQAKDKQGQRCVNIKLTHTAKGHQNDKGTIFFIGSSKSNMEFQSSYETEHDKKQANTLFSQTICKKLKTCITKYRSHTRDYKENKNRSELSKGEMRKAVASIHMSRIEKFRKPDLMKELVNHLTCFCCLTSSPSHKLFCGHIICQECLEGFSKEDSDFFVRVLETCPLCGKNDYKTRFEMKPPTAGPRILSLDGGGVRSVMQLEILKELERLIGLEIPIHKFFDLVIGTSGGGIVAAAIGLNRLRIDECLQLFTEFAKNAFKPHFAVSIPILGSLVRASHHGLYKTKGIEKALKSAFGDNYIFGQQLRECDNTIPCLKVGVTATSSSRHTFLLTNYNRPRPEKRLAKVYSSSDNGDQQDVNEGFGLGLGVNFDDKETVMPLHDEDSVEEESLLSNVVGPSIQPGTLPPHRSDAESIEEPFGSVTSKGVSTWERTVLEEASQELCLELPADDGYEYTDTGRFSLEQFTLHSLTDPQAAHTHSSGGETIDNEFKVWEAIRATSAAPGYFKSFTHQASKYTFDDGALKCNNPVFLADKERKVLWPNLSKRDPDMLLSIGAGSNLATSEKIIYDEGPKSGTVGYLKKMKRIGSDAVMEDMDCEHVWENFMERRNIESGSTDIRRIYQRLNPLLQDPVPSLDAVDKIPYLRQKATEFITGHPKAMDIANSLIGSLFYFELQSIQPDLRRSPTDDSGKGNTTPESGTRLRSVRHEYNLHCS